MVKKLNKEFKESNNMNNKDLNFNLNRNKIILDENFLNGINSFYPKNYKLEEKTKNSIEDEKNVLEKKFIQKDKEDLGLDITKKINSQRKKSLSGETTYSSDYESPEKDHKKKTFFNQSKIPFKGKAKDFKIKYKTELCKYFEAHGHCKYGENCAYAHGKENLRSKVTNTTAYRTKKCTQFFEKGYCPYGNRCQFAHQLKTNIINNPYDRQMSYENILKILSKLENVENIKMLVEKPRLPVFQNICKNNIKSRLLDDIKKLNYNSLYKRID